MENRKELSLKTLIALEVVIGIFVLIFAFIFESNNEIKKSEKEIYSTVQYIKGLCNSSEIRDMASEAKSLMLVTESVKQIRNRFDHNELDNDKDSDIWKSMTNDNYLDGMILLDDKGNVKADYSSCGIDCEVLISMIDSDELLDTISFPEKIYNIRLYMEEGGHVDLAAVSTDDHKSIIAGYLYTTPIYENIINNPIKVVVSGFNRESNGCVVIADDTDVLYTNDESLAGKKIESVEILNKINKQGAKTKLAYVKSKANPFSYQFGLMDKSRKYSIYVFMNEKDYFSSVITFALVIFLLYFVLIVFVDIILRRNHLSYEKEKLETNQRYMDVLEDKNRQLEDALKQARKANNAKTRFLSNMSHDIRTPINGIVGLLKINQDHFDDIDLVKSNYKKMQVAADHLLSLINDILQMSKIEDGTVNLTHDFIDFKEMSLEINTIIAERAIEHGISMEFRKGNAENYPNVYGSTVHLRQIFLNIYTNSIKYNHPGGKITTMVDIIDKCDGRCTYQWTIEDTGIGMNEEFTKHVFEPFVQEKDDARTYYQGVGLGMSIVKGLLDEMGGNISVSSKEGVGTTFVITIPFEIAYREEDSKAKLSEKDMDIKGLRLLLAEDNDLNAEIVETILTDEGTEITIVPDGQQAVDTFNDNPEGTFDAILMDVMMPVMDGLTATRQIRELNRPDAKTIPIIAMTANAFEEDREKCFDAGMNAHLAKPLDVEIVKKTLCRYVNKKTGSHE